MSTWVAIRRSMGRSEWDVLARMLSQARESAGLSQSELGRRLDVGQAYVWKVENGQRRLDVLELIDYARATGAEPAMIVLELDRLMRRTDQ